MPDTAGLEWRRDIRAVLRSEADQNPVNIVLVFSSALTAERLVLGVPALARALREVRLAGFDCCDVHVPDTWTPSPGLRLEVERLAPGLAIRYCEEFSAPAAHFLIGEALVDASGLADQLSQRGNGPTISASSPILSLSEATLSPASGNTMLDRRSRELLAATGKPGDGIISRTINRPISQRITWLLLSWLGPFPPMRATAVTALISLAMAAALVVLPGQTGLLVGALLFQAASIFDGVDGEIARATFRTSPRGASIDSLVDAATNFLFLGGVVLNLYLQDNSLTAGRALIGMVGLMMGTALLGLRAGRKRGIVDFETVKQELSGRNSRLMQWLTWLTMRDFYAFAAALLIAWGQVEPAVLAFDVVVAGWLLVVTDTLGYGRLRGMRWGYGDGDGDTA